MSLERNALWKKIQDHVPGHAGASLSFTQRLARENGWAQSYAGRVVQEYRRFVYLAVTQGHPVTPSDQVDQAWHLHLTYTRDYWEVFCPQVLGRALHHDPTRGGEDERAKYFDWYARTLAAYRAAFGEPPEDIWPRPQRRFAQRFERREVASLRPAALRAGASAIVASAMAGTAWAAQGQAAGGLVLFLLIMGAVFAVLILAFIRKGRSGRRLRGDRGGSGGAAGGCGSLGSYGDSGGESGGDGGGDGGGCGGGCGGGGCGS